MPRCRARTAQFASLQNGAHAAQLLSWHKAKLRGSTGEQTFAEAERVGFDLKSSPELSTFVARPNALRLSRARSSARTSEAGRPWGLRGFARAGLLVAWLVFWLNTALFPCCEVAAAVLHGHTDNGAQPASAAPPPHHAEVTHSEPLDHSPHSPCGFASISGPALAGEYEGLTPDRPPLERFAVDAPVATCPTAVDHSANLARAAPPPSPGFYMRTRRLLI